MRIVLDVNILVSAYIAAGTSNKVMLAAVRHGVYDMLICGHLLQELRDVLLRPNKHFDHLPGLVDGYLTVLYNTSVFIEAMPKPIPSYTVDPDDDYLVALALVGQADALVSNDDHLLQLGEIRDQERIIPILTGRQFLAYLQHNQLLPE